MNSLTQLPSVLGMYGPPLQTWTRLCDDLGGENAAKGYRVTFKPRMEKIMQLLPAFSLDSENQHMPRKKPN